MLKVCKRISELIMFVGLLVCTSGHIGHLTAREEGEPLAILIGLLVIGYGALLRKNIK